MNHFNIIKLNTHNPDALARAWRLGLSEFSVYYDLAFQKHLDKLTRKYKDYKIQCTNYRKHSCKNIKRLEYRISVLCKKARLRVSKASAIGNNIRVCQPRAILASQ